MRRVCLAAAIIAAFVSCTSASWGWPFSEDFKNKNAPTGWWECRDMQGKYYIFQFDSGGQFTGTGNNDTGWEILSKGYWTITATGVAVVNFTEVNYIPPRGVGGMAQTSRSVPPQQFRFNKTRDKQGILNGMLCTVRGG